MLGKGLFEESLERLDELVAEQPDDAELLFLYGVAAVGARQPTRATWPLREARLDPDWAVPAGVELAAAALSAKDPERAISAASEVLEIDPDHVRARVLRAQAYVEDEDFEAALADTDQLREADTAPNAWGELRLRALLGLGRIDEVEEMLSELDAEDNTLGSDNPKMCVTRAMFAHESGDSDLAEERFTKCLERHPTNKIVLSETIGHYDAAGKLEVGNDHLAQVLADAPENWEIRGMLAQRMAEQDRPEETERLLIEATELEGTGPAIQRSAVLAWEALAYHYFSAEQMADCIEAWEIMIEVAPMVPAEQRFAYAEALVVADRVEKASQVASELPEVFAELVHGRILLKQGNPAGALQRFEAGLRLWPNNGVARYFAAQAAQRSGNIDIAISHFRESLRVDASSSDAGLQLALLHEAEGALNPAFEAIQGHMKAHPDDLEGGLVAVRLAMLLGNGPYANRIVEQITTDPERRVRVIAEVAAAAAQAKDVASAIALIEKSGLDLRDPNNAPLLTSIASFLIVTGKPAEARRRVDEASAAHPENADLHALRGTTLEKSQSALEGARQAYERSLALEPNNVRALSGLARLAEREGERAQAYRFYEAAAEADTDSALLGRKAAEFAPDSTESRRRLEAHLIEHPYDGQAASQLASLIYASGAAKPNRGSSAQALTLLRRAMRFRGGPDAYELFTEILLERGEAKRAVDELRTLQRRQFGHNPALDYQLGNALAAAGDPAAARAAFARALEADHFPQRAAVETALAQLDSSAAESEPHSQQ
jgi:tetratricopeptide (TPR) repeat protein